MVDLKKLTLPPPTEQNVKFPNFETKKKKKMCPLTPPPPALLPSAQRLNYTHIVLFGVKSLFLPNYVHVSVYPSCCTPV